MCGHCGLSPCGYKGWSIMWSPYFGINEPMADCCLFEFKTDGLAEFTHKENFLYWNKDYPADFNCFPPHRVLVLDAIRNGSTFKD